MSDQMQAGASAAHPTVNISEPLNNLKTQLKEVEKILQKNVSLTQKLAEIEKYQKKITKSIWDSERAHRADLSVVQKILSAQKKVAVAIKVKSTTKAISIIIAK